MNILFIAPLPPPIHGQAYVSDVLLTELNKRHEVCIINITKKRNAGKLYFFERYLEVIQILFAVFKNRKNKDAIYITISQSFLGNIKDLLTYCCVYSNLSKMTIHLHGGSIKRELWDRHSVLLKLNKFFISKMNAAIISGESHREVFRDLIEENKIHIVPNFTMKEMFIPVEKVNKKFEYIKPLKVLYVSGMREKKGYLDVWNGFLELSKASQKKIEIVFAGEFETNSEEEQFRNAINGYANISYHGVINDSLKIKLFHESHIFCLPTKYLEGQPISIIEAYAAGCVVLTTNLGGIVDIFDDKINGFQSNSGDARSVADKFEFCLTHRELIGEIASGNLELAEKMYRKDKFIDSTSKIILN
jgi:glycosyltransferase involved in cell wall biosynthesis